MDTAMLTGLYLLVGIIILAIIIGFMKFRKMRHELKGWQDMNVGIEGDSADEVTVVLQGKYFNRRR